MRAAYVDSSCLIAIATGEPGWEEVAARLDSFDRFVSSNLLEAELRAALLREGLTDLADPLLEQITWILPSRPLHRELRSLIDQGHLRGADLWHLACALFATEDSSKITFATLDRRQAEMAARMGFGLLS